MSEYEELFETRIRLNERIAETESYIKLLQEQLAELKTLRENLESLRGGGRVRRVPFRGRNN